jgi:hypothetical protein
VIEAILILWLLLLLFGIVFGENKNITEQGKWRILIEFIVVISCLTLIEVFK